jgi:hypothetical protein
MAVGRALVPETGPSAADSLSTVWESHKPQGSSGSATTETIKVHGRLREIHQPPMTLLNTTSGVIFSPT